MATPYSDDGWGSSPPKASVQRDFGYDVYKSSNTNNYHPSASSSCSHSPPTTQTHNVQIIDKINVSANLRYGYSRPKEGTYISGNNLDELPVKDPVDPHGYAPNNHTNGANDCSFALPTPNITNGFIGLQHYLEELSHMTAQKLSMDDQARFVIDILSVVQATAQDLVNIYHTYHGN